MKPNVRVSSDHSELMPKFHSETELVTSGVTSRVSPDRTNGATPTKIFRPSTMAVSDIEIIPSHLTPLSVKEAELVNVALGFSCLLVGGAIVIGADTRFIGAAIGLINGGWMTPK